VTPENIRLRKRLLQANDRKKAQRAANRVADAS
jgi:predicted membrane GTPase involved in stress response